jgi:ABC-2 type transport system permease protein
MRAVIQGLPFTVSDIAWGIALAAIYIVLAGWYFARVYRYTVRTGLLARYSAEGAA